MAKSTVLRGEIFLKEVSLTESASNRILTYDSSTGQVTYREALTGVISSTLSSGQILVGNGSNVATAVTMSGDGTISNAGVFSIASNSIVNADVNSSAAIAYSKLNLTGTILNADISASAAIAYSKLNLANSVVNADISGSASIGRTKIATGTSYRILANNASGQLSENAAITALSAVVSDGNGQLIAQVDGTTSQQIGYLSNTTGDIQNFLDNFIATKPVDSLVKSPSSSEDGFAISWDDGAQQYTLIDPVTQGIPTAGSARQFLGKNSGTNYDADWLDIVVSDVSDLTGNADDYNVLSGSNALGLSTDDIFNIIGLTSPVQAQIDGKLNDDLNAGAIFYGNPSGVASMLSPGSNGQVLTLVSGYPVWQTLTGTGTVTSVQVSGGATGLSFSGGPVTTSGTITMAGTLDANNGGTGFSAYTIGDILYADSVSTLAKLGIGSDGDVLTLSGGVPTWVTGGGSVSDGDYGDITISSSGSVWTVDADINKAWVGTHSFLDNSFTLLDNVDNTKILAFQLSGISAGQTRTLTAPDLSGTIAVLGGSGNGAALTKVDDTNVTLTLGGGPSTALLTAASLTLGWTGQLGVTRGGTGLASVAQGDILYSDASNSLVTLAKNTNATRYLSNTGASNNPAWAQIDLTNGVTGSLPIGSVSGLGTGVGTFLGTPSWTNFNSMITGTAPYWSLASGGTLTGSNVITGTGQTLKGEWNGIGTTQTNGHGWWLANTTAAAAGAQQISPSLVLEGQGWKTNATAASQSVKWAVDVLPIQGTANPSSRLLFKTSVNSGAYSTLFQLDETGFHRFGSSGPAIYPSNSAATLAVAGGGLTIQGVTGTGATNDALGVTITEDANRNQNLLRLYSAPGGAISSGSFTRGGILIDRVYNFTGGTWTAFGLDYNPTLTSVTGLTNYFLRSSSGLSGFGTRTPTATAHIKSYGTTTGEALRVEDSASVARLLILDNGNISVTKGIDTTAGDSATINAVAGRFRKDTSGAIFTLTNSFITTNSIIDLTPANAAIDATCTQWTVSAGAGSATITFNAAPTSNFDMNFIVLN